MKKTYDKTEIYTNEILPVLKQLAILCQKEEIPMFMAFAVSNNADGTVYKTQMASPELLNIDLTNDKLTSMLLLLQDGFMVSRGNLPIAEEEFDFVDSEE